MDFLKNDTILFLHISSFVCTFYINFARVGILYGVVMIYWIG